MSLKKDAESASPSDLVNIMTAFKNNQSPRPAARKMWRIFYMNRFEGMKYTEIAEKLSVSVKTVEANMEKH